MRTNIPLISSRLAAICAVALFTAADVYAGQLVPVPRIVIYPGSTIASSALEDRLMQLGSEPERSWHVSRSSLVGKTTQRTLLPGRAIMIEDVKSPDRVQSGKSVVIQFDMAGLRITGQGVALQGGEVGAQIAVRNSESGTVVRGTITEDGIIKVGE